MRCFVFIGLVICSPVQKAVLIDQTHDAFHTGIYADHFFNIINIKSSLYRTAFYVRHDYLFADLSPRLDIADCAGMATFIASYSA